MNNQITLDGIYVNSSKPLDKKTYIDLTKIDSIQINNELTESILIDILPIGVRYTGMMITFIGLTYNIDTNRFIITKNTEDILICIVKNDKSIITYSKFLNDNNIIVFDEELTLSTNQITIINNLLIKNEQIGKQIHFTKQKILIVCTSFGWKIFGVIDIPNLSKEIIESKLNQLPYCFSEYNIIYKLNNQYYYVSDNKLISKSFVEVTNHNQIHNVADYIQYYLMNGDLYITNKNKKFQLSNKTLIIKSTLENQKSIITENNRYRITLEDEINISNFDFQMYINNIKINIPYKFIDKNTIELSIYIPKIRYYEIYIKY